ncbi:MAG: DNA gyrase/topoisomerase IV subunit A [Prevotellaceae bacterium]|jgi:topoisomerase-4 subunit A|nr:DNA gyrase/topoisomerase IV subunit A [Prevotellaceae bacterium]
MTIEENLETENTIEPQPAGDEQPEAHSRYKVPVLADDSVKYHLSGMYQSWFLDYASYVNLERAVPHINDGLKPVQRRILHSMKRMDDGRYNKVANVVGHTMQFHPHGDASIGDALVNMGQKELLIDTQGNWGNILTGDGAAAPRYIEARLSKFALEVLFSPKITEWKASYDGRNKEPVSLPVKFPLLLAQGTEGIGVGLNSKILPHNFNELIDAAISCLKGEDFVLLPDFLTGGSIDVAKYNDGQRGGQVKIRAKISKIDNKTLVISEIPYGTNTGSVQDSIVKANERGKIKIRKVDDNTAANVEILVHLVPGTSSDKAIDALYAFTNCEMSVSPNCCVISDNKPHFLRVSDVLRYNVETTKELLRKELEIQKAELLEQLHFASLEKIFIEERIYKDKKFEESASQDEAIGHIDNRLEPFKKDFIREVTREDILRLLEIKMGRILRFNSDKAEENIALMKGNVEEIDYHLAHLVEYTITWFSGLKARYGKLFPRRTEIRNFETIVATKVVEANEKLYINREEGFIGTSLRKDEFVCNCSDMDDIIVFFKDGKYKVVKVSDKLYVGKNVLYLAVFKKNDKRTVYNAVYRDGRDGAHYIKRFSVTGVTRDKEYDITQGTPNSKLMYFSANPNGEAEIIKVTLKPKPRLKILVFEKDFGEIAIKGRASMGNVLSKNDIHKIALKQKGGSTLGGRKVWFDHDVLRLNYDGRGEFLGEYHSDDQILVVTKNGEYYTTSFDLNNHYDNDLLKVEQFDAEKIWSVALYDAEQGFSYIKRFQFEPSQKRQNFLGDNADSRLILLSGQVYPRFEVVFGGADAHRQPMEIDVDEFVGVKSFKAKGKRISTFEVAKVKELEPTRFPEAEEGEVTDETENQAETPTAEAKEVVFYTPTSEPETEEEKSKREAQDIVQITNEITGQMSLF